MKKKVSIIVRTHNESYWIGKCLHEIFNQKYKNFEVIVVDNQSKDDTKKIVKKNFPNCKLVNYKSKVFKPGAAINHGIKFSKGELVCIISGHCIPKNEQWLGQLVKNFKSKKIAGVYGKQEPLDTSDPNIVRELNYLFGNDKKIQVKDPFFHNANSMIRKSLWKKINFDEQTFHIEDRIWAQQVQSLKYRIIYEPNSIVYHHHGVGHNDNIKRVSRISKIIQNLNLKKQKSKQRIICMVPIINPIKKNNTFIVEKILNELNESTLIFKTFVICSNKELKNKIRYLKKINLIDRPKYLQKDYLGTDYILKETYKKFIKKKCKPTHIMVLEEVYPYRPKNLIKDLINKIDEKYDSIVPICKINDHNIWKKNDFGQMNIIFKTSMPSSYVTSNVFKEIKGLGCITKSSVFEHTGRETMSINFLEVLEKYSTKLK